MQFWGTPPPPLHRTAPRRTTAVAIRPACAVEKPSMSLLEI